MVQKPSAVNPATYLRAIPSSQGAKFMGVQECRTGMSLVVAVRRGGLRSQLSRRTSVEVS